MRSHLIKNKLLSTLLVFALLFALLPTTAWAAAATGTASGTAGYNNIAVSLSGASQFAGDAAVQNTSNWELVPTGGTQTILGITKHDPQYVSIVLSAPIQAGQTFTIDAAAEVFAPGTDMFPSPLDVNITVPTPAMGTAAATSGSKDIAVILTGGTFGSESAVETKSFWTLGGDSASANSIASVTYVDSTHATVTLTNNIGASDTYTITATQFVFVNAAIAPFASPLSVTVEPAAEPLTLIGAAVTAGGGVGLTFNKDLSPTDIATKVATGFSITGLEETPKTITNVTLHSASGGTNNFIQLYLNPTVKGGEVVGLQYTPSGVQSLDGDVLAAIAAMDIENYLPHPDLVTTAPPAATVGSAYTHTLTAGGGTGPYTFSIDSGNLPNGLTMSSAGVISGTPTVAASSTFFVMVQDANQSVDIEGFSITVNAPSANICTIEGGAEYATLDAALASISEGETKTITLLKNIDYDKGITLINKKITFVLNGHTLNVVSSIEGVSALTVSNGGCVYLSGTGALNVTGPARGYGVTVASNTTTSVVTVTNATGIGTESKAAHAYSKASLTVLEDVTATGINSFGVHAQSGAFIEVLGNVSADNQGVCVSSAAAKVAGNIQSNGNDLIGNPEGIGVNAYDGVVEIGGDVTANRVGAMITAGGSITINGMLTAPAYIQFADDAPTAIDGYLATTTKPGYRTYQHSTAGTVWMLGDMPITIYALIVTNGTGSYSYAKDAVIAITANTAPSGQRFKEWSIAPSVTFADGTNKTSQTAKIIMPAQPVAATAIYEVLPASEYTITVQNDGNGTANANRNSAAEGAEITLIATPNNGYRFKEWHVISGGVTIVNNKFSILDSNVTVTAEFEVIPPTAYTVTIGTLSGGTITPSAPTAAAGTTINLTITPNYGKQLQTGTLKYNDISDHVISGTSFTMPAANVTVTAEFENVPSTSGGGGGTQADTGTKITVSTTDSSASVTGTLTQTDGGAQVVINNDAFDQLDTADRQVTIGMQTAAVTFDTKALDAIGAASGTGDVMISARRVAESELSDRDRALIGSRPVYDFTVTSGGSTISSFGGGYATVSISYKLLPGENPRAIVIWYLSDDGKLVGTRGCYDAATGTVMFMTPHFSRFMVGYNLIAFNDVVSGAWYHDAVTFLAARGITTGTSATAFSPDATLTRGQFIVMLLRAYGIEPDSNTTENFSDAGDTYYTSYLAAAKRIGISNGVGNNMFAPDKSITRQEMFALLYNALKAIGEMPASTSGKTLSDFSDVSDIASWAKDAMTLLVESGTVSGSGGKLNPTGTTTRAEMAQVLYNLLTAE